MKKPRIAIVSPFLDRRHGTEQSVVEWIMCLAEAFEIHIYSQRIDDLDLSKVVWHRIPKLRGPHLANYLWWLAANHLWRAWDRRVRGIRHELVFSPGVNCFDADAISVHIVFREYAERIRPEIALARNPLSSWPRLIHRKLYYRLVAELERRVYSNPRTALILVARKAARDLGRYYGRREQFPVLYAGVNHAIFNPARREARRDAARRSLGLAANRFAVLLIGNDWRNKGLPVLLDAIARLADLPLDLLAVGDDDPSPYRRVISGLPANAHIRFLPPRIDVDFYYAAADAYAGPSIEDAFALPPVEAMACGLPVIVSSAAGVSEIVTNSVDGLILDDPTDGASLAAMIRRLYEDKEFRASLGARAAETAMQYTWERNGRELGQIFEEILRRKARPAAETATQES